MADVLGMDREQLGIKPKTQRGTLKAFYRNSVHEGGYLLPLGDIGGEFMSLLEKLAERYSVSVPELRSNTIVNIKAVRLMAQASKEVMATEDSSRYRHFIWLNVLRKKTAQYIRLWMGNSDAQASLSLSAVSIHSTPVHRLSLLKAQSMS